MKVQREANGAGEGRHKTMLERSPPLTSSGIFSSNYTEVLPDASNHCQKKKSVCTEFAYLLGQKKGNSFPCFVYTLCQYSLEISIFIYQ